MNDSLRQQRDVIALGSFTIDLQRGDLFDSRGQRVLLRRQALDVLLELARHEGNVLTRKALAEAVWKGVRVTDDSLVQCVVEIRRALGREAAAKVKTVPRRGYALESGAGQPAVPPALAAQSGLVASLASTYFPGLPFVGRGAELDALVTRSGRPGAPGCLVLILGEPGIGKSRLVEEAACAASTEGAATLLLKCHEIESGIAYGALSQLIDRLVALANDDELQTLDNISRAELAALVPWCAARLEPLAQLSETDAGLRQAHLRAALVALCGAAGARQRLILCIDDAHWLDEASAVTLFAVAEAASRNHYAVWATLRRDEIARSPNAERLVHALQALQHTSRLELGRLKPEEVESIVAQVHAHQAIDARQVDWLVRESAGNPFYLRELMQANLGAGDEPMLAQDGVGVVGGVRILPPGILDAVLRRARHLSHDALRLLEAAAVLEQSAVFDVLCRVARQERHIALEALEALMSAGWLVEDREQGRYLFAHDKLREAIGASLSAAMGSTLHGRAAHALLDQAAQRKAAPEHAVVAAHAQHAGQDALAREQFALAGDAARGMFELRRAEALYTRALSFERGPPDGGAAGAQMALLEKRGAVRSMLGAAAEAEADLRSAIALAQSHQAGPAAAGSGDAAYATSLRLHIELGVLLQRHHRLEDALGVLGRALELACAAKAEDAIAAAHCWLGDVEWMRERNRAARTHFEAVMGVGDPASFAIAAAQTKALFGLAQCAGMNARPARADTLLDQAFARAQTTAQLFFECAWNVLKGWIRVGGHGMGEPEAAREHFERCLTLSRRTDLFWYAVPCNIGIGVVHATLRRFDTAIEHFESVLRLPADAHNDRWRPSAGVWLASCHLDRGDAAAALDAARQAQRALDEAGPFMFAAKLPALITTALVRLGRGHECADPQALIEHARRDEIGYAVIAALEARAEWLCARGDLSQLIQCADELLREATDRGLPQARAAAAHWRARAQAV